MNNGLLLPFFYFEEIWQPICRFFKNFQISCLARVVEFWFARFDGKLFFLHPIHFLRWWEGALAGIRYCFMSRFLGEEGGGGGIVEKFVDDRRLICWKVLLLGFQFDFLRRIFSPYWNEIDMCCYDDLIKYRWNFDWLN